MDFNELVGEGVNVTAKVGKVGLNHIGVDMVVLEEVFINGSYFRNHSHIKMTKRLQHLKRGDVISARATLRHYIDVDTNKLDKLGFKSFRSVQVLELS